MSPIKEKQIYLYLVMASVSIVIAATSIGILYNVSFEQQKQGLKDLVQSRARFVESHIRQDSSPARLDAKSPFERTLELLRMSQEDYAGFGKTGEFTMANLDNDKVHFLIRHRHDSRLLDEEAYVPFQMGSENSVPIQRALAGLSGTMIGEDYRGVSVLAAYEPVKFEDFPVGIVAKVDLPEIRAPFIRAAIITSLCAIVAIIIGTLIFRRVSDTIIDELYESEVRYRQLVELSPDGIIIHSGGKVVFSNSAASQLAGGKGPEDLFGKPVLGFVHPDYHEFVKERIRIMMEEKKKLPLAEEKFIRLDGREIDVEVTSMPIVYMKKPAVQLVFRDIRDRRQRDEERSRLVKAIEQSAETVVITDVDGNIQYANPYFEKSTGYTREEAIGKNPRILQSGKHPKSFYANLWETVTGGKVWSGYFVNKKKDGTLYEEEATISPVFDKSGKIVNYVAVKRDVTHEKSLQRAKEYFTAVTSHELRTPVTKLKLVKKLLNDIFADEKPRPEFDKVMSTINETDSSLNRILMETELLTDLSLTQTEKNLRKVFIHNVLSVCIENALESGMKEHRKVLIIQNLDNIPVAMEIFGNNDMVKTVFDNILSNAIKYTPDGKSINISAGIQDGSIVVEFKDEGVGIPKEIKERVFEPYYSLSNVLNYSTGQYKFKGGGVGLGLTISRMIMEFHNGELLVESEGVDMGTKITLKFPLLQKG